MSIEAMKLAILTLEWANEEINGWMDDAYKHDPIDHPEIMSAITALSQAIEQAQKQEPVAWMFQHEETGRTTCVDAQQLEWGFEQGNPRLKKIAPLYTSSPPQRQPLSREVIERDFHGRVNFVRQVEAAHGIKEAQ